MTFPSSLGSVGGWLNQAGSLFSTTLLFNLLPATLAGPLANWAVAQRWLAPPTTRQAARTYHLSAQLLLIILLAIYQVSQAIRTTTANPTFYTTLGVHGGIQATEATIRRRYRLLVKALHPDKIRRHDPSSAQQIAQGIQQSIEQRFHAVVQASQTLLDPTAREVYDRLGLVAAPTKGRGNATASGLAAAAAAAADTPSSSLPTTTMMHKDFPARLRYFLAEAASTYVVRVIVSATFQTDHSPFLVRTLFVPDRPSFPSRVSTNQPLSFLLLVY